MMKKFLIPALALAAASVAVPAMAQSYGDGWAPARSRPRDRARAAVRGDLAEPCLRSPVRLLYTTASADHLPLSVRDYVSRKKHKK